MIRYGIFNFFKYYMISSLYAKFNGIKHVLINRIIKGLMKNSIYSIFKANSIHS